MIVYSNDNGLDELEMNRGYDDEEAGDSSRVEYEGYSRELAITDWQGR